MNLTKFVIFICNTTHINADPDFVMWCIDQARFSPIFSIRGTCFMVLGLMSRTEKGLHALYEANWHCASHRNVAVAIPREEGDLFEPMCGHGN